jgi:DNA-binding transcriptional LysR family regulator
MKAGTGQRMRLTARQLKSFDLNLLVALDALLSERSVTLAAQRCAISQPSMSVALRRLREYFADPLLIAHGRELRLSAHARALAGPVRETLAMLRAMLRTHSG